MTMVRFRQTYPAPRATLPLGQSLGAPASNGTAAGAFFITNVSIYATKNVTEWGPGSNDRCSQPYLTEFLPLSGGGGGGTAFVPISTPSNLSDRGEATNATVWDASLRISERIYCSQ